MTPYERLFWLGCGWGALVAASCLLMPWVVMAELQRQREAEQMPGNVVQFRRRG